MQGYEDVGHEWCQILYLSFDSLRITPIITCKGLFVWYFEDSKSYTVLITDGAFVTSTHKKYFERLLLQCSKLFSYTTREGHKQSFLQSKYGTSMDQSNHFQQKILDVDFKQN